MWLVRSLALFVVIASVLAFAIVNVEHRTTLTLFTHTYRDVALNVVLFCAVVVGAAVMFLAMTFREFTLRAAIRRLRRENMRLDDELTALRNLPLAGIEPGKEPPGAAGGKP